MSPTSSFLTVAVFTAPIGCPIRLFRFLLRERRAWSTNEATAGSVLSRKHRDLMGSYARSAFPPDWHIPPWFAVHDWLAIP